MIIHVIKHIQDVINNLIIINYRMIQVYVSMIVHINISTMKLMVMIKFVLTNHIVRIYIIIFMMNKIK